MVDWIIPGNDDALRAIRLFTTKIADSVAEGRAQYEQSQVADQKAAADQAALEAGPDYVDTAPTRSTRSKKGEFVEGTEAFIEAAGTTVPPDEESRNNGARLNHFCWPGAESEIHTGHFVRVCNREFRKEKRMSTSKPVMEIPASSSRN